MPDSDAKPTGPIADVNTPTKYVAEPDSFSKADIVESLQTRISALAFRQEYEQRQSRNFDLAVSDMLERFADCVKRAFPKISPEGTTVLITALINTLGKDSLNTALPLITTVNELAESRTHAEGLK